MPTRVPNLLTGLFDDAVLLPPGADPVTVAIAAHHVHRRSWYANLIGPLAIPASQVGAALEACSAGQRLPVGLVADAGPADAGVAQLLAAVRAVASEGPDRLEVRYVEMSAAMRGQDPRPGLRAALDLDHALRTEGSSGRVTLFAEIPLTWGVLAGLDTLAEAAAQGAGVVPRFRTGGLAVELFPTPVELAAVVCACRDRGLTFKLTSAVHRAVRRTDPETGLVNHGFLNILAAVLAAGAGAEAVDLAELLAETSASPLVHAVREHLDDPRPHLTSMGGCGGLEDTLADLRTLGIVIRSTA